MKDFLNKLKEYNKILKLETIARRYLVMNAFDGVLTILGILIGGYLANINDSRIILVAGFGASIAMGVAGFWGAYLTEKAERQKELRELEKSMLAKLRKSKIGRASRIAPYILSVVDGLAPFFAALFVLLPFFFFPVNLSYYFSISLAFVLLFLLGLFLGKISKENLVISGLRMALAGIICIVLSMLLGYAKIF